MSTQDDIQKSLDLLDTTLEIYGGDLQRWPEQRRLRLSALVSGNTDAKRRIAAARALDQVLEFAPRLGEAQTVALVDRIVARAARQPRVVTATAKPPRQWFGGRTNHGIAGAALAASLLIGIMSGQSGSFATLSDALTGGSSASAASQQVAQGDETDTILDEDLL